MVERMQMKHTSSRDNLNIMFWGCIITSISTILYLGFLFNANIYLLLGQYKLTMYTTLLIGLFETIQYGIYASRTRNHKRHTFTQFCKSCGILFVIFLNLYFFIVVFGASVFTQLEETRMFALLLTVVTALPALLYVGPDLTIDMFCSLTKYENEKYGLLADILMHKIRCCLMGAWLGAIPIPLDWDRPWQNWPITCCLGTLFGYLIGNFNAIIIYLNSKKEHKSTRKTGKVV